MSDEYRALNVFALMFSIAVLTFSQVTIAATPIQNAYELIEDTMNGGGPFTVDPAASYDSASDELVFNVYEPLIFFEGERYDMFRLGLSADVVVGPREATAPSYTNFTVYFKIRENVPFQTWSRADEGNLTWAQYYLHPYDVEYSFERIMVHDYLGGPQWMVFEPLLDCFTANPSDPNFGAEIDGAVESNSTHVWFNIANQGLVNTSATTFAPLRMFDVDGNWNVEFWNQTPASLPINYALRIFFQVLAQRGLVVSEDWTLGWLNPYLSATGSVTDWPGTFSNWTSYWQPSTPIYDLVGTTYKGVTCGTGPFTLGTYNPTSGGAWTAAKFDGYWSGWPAQSPSPPYWPQISSGIASKGWVNKLTVRQKMSSEATNDLISGACDFAYVPRSLAGSLHVGGDRFAQTLDGISLDYPLPSMAMDSFHFTFYIEPTPGNTYGRINANNTLSEDAIPANFFVDIHVRRAFAYLLNSTAIIIDQYLGEAYQPRTCAPDGLPYANPSQTKYGPSVDFSRSKEEFDRAFGGNLKNIGFAINITYNAGSLPQPLSDNLASMINSIGNMYYGGKFHASALAVPWGSYVADIYAHELPTFVIGYLSDYCDLHNYMQAYMLSKGEFGVAQRYQNPIVDDLLDKGLRTPDGPGRQSIYGQLQSIYYNEVPSVVTHVVFQRGYMRDWVCGHYYNPLFQGIRAYGHWKWNYLKGDVNYDAKVDMGDVTTILKGFGSFIHQGGGLTIHPRWNFYCDVYDSPRYRWRDRKIDLGDIVNTLPNFGKTSTQWQPPS